MDEKKLVKKILAGNQEAVDCFYRQYQKPLLSFVQKRSQTVSDAQDIVQEAFISALNSLPNFKFQSPLFSWLCAIARHETADFYRRKKIKTVLFSRLPILEQLASQALGPEGKVLKQELKKEIVAVLQQLSEGYSKILRLKYIEGLPVKDIARRLKTTAKAVESRLTRARRRFKKIWQKNQ